MPQKLSRAHFDAESFLRTLRGGTKLVDYRKKSSIFVQGEPAGSVFYIQKGRVKLTVTSAQGKAAIIGVLDAGNLFGEGCLAGQPHRMMTATAVLDCFLLRIEKTAMMDVLRNRKEFSEFFINYVLARNIRYEADLVDQLFNSSERRLAFPEMGDSIYPLPPHGCSMITSHPPAMEWLLVPDPS